nr:MAG TPA: hypothetical protein [Herelleviridae sp.]
MPFVFVCLSASCEALFLCFILPINLIYLSLLLYT